MIRDMAGRSYRGDETSGELSTLDLSEARIVAGREDYYYSNGPFYTKNDKIGDYTFYNCLKLTMVKLPTSVIEIGRNAFSGCTGLTSINIPASVTSIGSSAFSGCTGLTSIYSHGTIPASISSDTFYGVDKKFCILYIPKGSYQDYWLVNNWTDFENIVEFDPTGIDYTSTQPEATETSRYTLDGQKLNAPSKGMNIVKYSDGTVKKVVVK